MGFIQRGAEEVFRNVLREVRAREDLENQNIRPTFDPREHREYLKEAAGDRKSSAYRQALQHHGFKWWPANTLPPMDGQPHKEGQWRHPRIGAFYPSDIVTLFPGGPESFDRWCREQKMLKSKNAPPKAERRKILARR